MARVNLKHYFLAKVMSSDNKENIYIECFNTLKQAKLFILEREQSTCEMRNYYIDERKENGEFTNVLHWCI